MWAGCYNLCKFMEKRSHPYTTKTSSLLLIAGCNHIDATTNILEWNGILCIPPWGNLQASAENMTSVDLLDGLKWRAVACLKLSIYKINLKLFSGAGRKATCLFVLYTYSIWNAYKHWLFLHLLQICCVCNTDHLFMTTLPIAFLQIVY